MAGLIISIGFATLLGLTGAGTYLMIKIISPGSAPYALGERQKKLDELEADRAIAIETATKPETLDMVTDLYAIRLREIENHK